MGSSSRTRAAAPAACGEAMEVPPLSVVPPPMSDDVVQQPGASRSSEESELEAQTTVSTGAGMSAQRLNGLGGHGPQQTPPPPKGLVAS